MDTLTFELPAAELAGTVDLRRRSSRSALGDAVKRISPAGQAAGVYPVGLPAYHHFGILGAPEKVSVTVMMLERLQQAQRSTNLPLCVLDGIRSVQLQRQISSQSPAAVREGYIASERESRHVRGEAVDLTFLFEGKPLLLGSGFDHFGARSHRGEHQSVEVLLLRRHLDELMEGVGLLGHPMEWWHYSTDGS